MSALLAYIHLMALPLGFVSVVLRGLRLKESLKTGETAKILFADNLWGITAVIWIVTGLLRAFVGFEKGTPYYLQNHWFWLKMVLFTMVFLLEVYPIVTFSKWRMQKKTHVTEAEHPLIKKLIKLNRTELLLIAIIPFAAVVMARGGFR